MTSDPASRLNAALEGRCGRCGFWDLRAVPGWDQVMWLDQKSG